MLTKSFLSGMHLLYQVLLCKGVLFIIGSMLIGLKRYVLVSIFFFALFGVFLVAVKPVSAVTTCSVQGSCGYKGGSCSPGQACDYNPDDPDGPFVCQSSSFCLPAEDCNLNGCPVGDTCTGGACVSDDPPPYDVDHTCFGDPNLCVTGYCNIGAFGDGKCALVPGGMPTTDADNCSSGSASGTFPNLICDDSCNSSDVGQCAITPCGEGELCTSVGNNYACKQNNVRCPACTAPLPDMACAPEDEGICRGGIERCKYDCGVGIAYYSYQPDPTCSADSCSIDERGDCRVPGGSTQTCADSENGLIWQADDRGFGACCVYVPPTGDPDDPRDGCGTGCNDGFKCSSEEGRCAEDSTGSCGTQTGLPTCGQSGTDGLCGDQLDDPDCADTMVCVQSNGSCQTVMGKCGVGDIPPIDTNTYTGPILSIDALLSALYAIILPAGIGYGAYSIIKAGYTLKTSEGNPQQIKEGQEEFTAAIVGTLFILLSVVALRVIISSVLGATAPGF